MGSKLKQKQLMQRFPKCLLCIYISLADMHVPNLIDIDLSSFLFSAVYRQPFCKKMFFELRRLQTNISPKIFNLLFLQSLPLYFSKMR